MTIQDVEQVVLELGGAFGGIWFGWIRGTYPGEHTCMIRDTKRMGNLGLGTVGFLCDPDQHLLSV
jgi:hypothetical protein